MARAHQAAEVPLPASKTQIDRAGQLVREWWTASDVELEGDYADAASLVYDFRDGFQEPLRRVTMGIRSMVSSESAPIVVSQRLKRTPTIVGKLARFPRMRLSQMQDIAGCRAVVPERSHVEGVVARIEDNWNVVRIDDYWVAPKPTGYRAVHVVVERMGRLVEIQLRTPRQQLWAQEVDRVGGRIGYFLKDGEGPRELLRYFERIAHVAALREMGEADDQEALAEIVALGPHVTRYFE